MPQLGYSKLPANEEAICLRVREVRLAAGISQTTHAGMLGITRERLASYEYARAPVRWGLGNRLCEIHLLSQRWLAAGLLPLKGFYSEGDTDQISPSILFSEGYQALAPRISKMLNGLDELRGKFAPKSKAEGIKLMRENLALLISSDARVIPDAKFEEFCSQLTAFSRVLVSKYGSKRKEDKMWDTICSLVDRERAASDVHARLLMRLAEESNGGVK